MMKMKIGKIILPLVLILVVIVCIANMFIIRPNEFAVIKQFGKVVKVIDTDGLKFKIPFIETIQRLPKHKLLFDAPATEINTFDKKRIMVDYYTVWRIVEPVDMLETLKTIQGAESRLSDIMYSSVRNELGKLEYGAIINPADNNRGSIDTIVQDHINEILEKNKNGIQIVDVQMKRIDLPDSNEQSVYKRMISERDSKAQEYLSKGEAEKTRIIAEVDREVAELISKTNAEAEEIKAQGQQEAAKIYNDSYGKDAEFFKLFTTLQSYKKAIDGETVIMVPIDSPYFKFLMGQ